MDRSKHNEDAEAIARRWFPEMEPLPGSTGAIASRRMAGSSIGHDVMLVTEDRRFSLAHEAAGTDPAWILRDSVAKIEVPVSAVSEARKVLNELDAMTKMTAAAGVEAKPERVVLNIMPDGLTAGLFVATVEFDDGNRTLLGLFTVLDPTRIAKMLALCGLSGDVPAVMGSGRV